MLPGTIGGPHVSQFHQLRILTCLNLGLWKEDLEKFLSSYLAWTLITSNP